MKNGGKGPHRPACGNDSDPELRLWVRVDKSGGPDACWPYIGARESNGYGYPTWGPDWKHVLAHRLAYELTTGPIPKGMLVQHSCDNPPCCNPKHLSVGTKQTNSDDMVRKGRGGQQGEKSIHVKLTTEQVREIRALFRREHATKSNTKALAEKYGVNNGTIRDIVLRLTWTHV